MATEKIYGGSQLGKRKDMKERERGGEGERERERERESIGWWKTENEPDDSKHSLAERPVYCSFCKI